mmetsp:Transcript_33677/g.52019  ORF Transcript_33677/g.52019 Transcript_33677/m.52019 type:complete len:309 (+) Transcript_33677:2966-3892(+)
MRESVLGSLSVNLHHLLIINSQDCSESLLHFSLLTLAHVLMVVKSLLVYILLQLLLLLKLFLLQTLGFSLEVGIIFSEPVHNLFFLIKVRFMPNRSVLILFAEVLLEADLFRLVVEVILFRVFEQLVRFELFLYHSLNDTIVGEHLLERLQLAADLPFILGASGVRTVLQLGLKGLLVEILAEDRLANGLGLRSPLFLHLLPLGLFGSFPELLLLSLIVFNDILHGSLLLAMLIVVVALVRNLLLVDKIIQTVFRLDVYIESEERHVTSSAACVDLVSVELQPQNYVGVTEEGSQKRTSSSFTSSNLL